MTIKTNVITVDEAIEKGFYLWGKNSNDCEFKGYVSGYTMGFCVEVMKKDGTLGYCSMSCTNDYEEMVIPSGESLEWNSLGISANAAMFNGNTPTGNIVFRGYWSEYYDFDEREECVKSASKEVLGLLDKYCVA